MRHRQLHPLTLLSLSLSCVLITSGPVSAETGDDGGECSGGFCGVPDQTGGAPGGAVCVAGVCTVGSILIARTDIGDTYQFSDDFDNDGFEDDFDNCPFSRNIDQIDSDGDSVGDACDICRGHANALQEDADSDGIGDACDADADNDGMANTDDNCWLVANPNRLDTDGDGLGNACDLDDDNDGVADRMDECPLALDPSSGLCDSDTDEDGVPDSVDNCLAAKNFGQADLDGDGVGDLCDADADGDGIANIRDNCGMVANSALSDADRDGRGDACDDRFCYVVGGAADHCLDPEVTFTVLSLPEVETSLSDMPMLHLFSNLENRSIRYNFSIVNAPSDSQSARILNGRGSVSESQAFEYRYPSDKIARFAPDVPGAYEVQLSAELADGTDDFGVSTSRTTIRFLVNEDQGEQASGCTCVVPTQSSGLIGLLALAGMLAFTRRRGRR